MPRTTVDIEASILNKIRALKKTEGRSMGRIISQLLAEALAHRKESSARLHWHTGSMSALVDLSDKEAVRSALDEGS